MQQLGTEVLKLVLEGNGTGNGHTICREDKSVPNASQQKGREEAHTLGDLGRAITRLNQDVATLGAESGGDGLGEGVDTSQQSGAALDAELELLFVAAESASLTSL